MGEVMTVVSTFRALAFLAAVIALVIWAPAAVLAQQFRIYTTVSLKPSTGPLATADGGSNVQPASAESAVVARSLTFFHAGRVYDYMDEVGELIVFEPVHERFLVLSGTRLQATTVEFAEVNQFLRVVDKEADELEQSLGNRPDPVALQELSLLRFQRNPQFSAAFTPAGRRLSLTSELVEYDCRVAADVPAETVTAYLNWADWMARLNYILHAQAFLPQARIALNQQLRERSLFPLSVELTLRGKNSVSLQAEHSVRWELDMTDRSRITAWDRLLRDPRVQPLSFHEYQRSMLTAAPSETTSR